MFIDAENRIQILPTIAAVAFADKGQGAAFIVRLSLFAYLLELTRFQRDERMLVVWADEIEGIAEQVKDLNTRLLSLVWKHRVTNIDVAPSAAGMPGAPTLSAATASKPSAPLQPERVDPVYDFASSFPADFSRDGPAPPPLPESSSGREPELVGGLGGIPPALPPVAGFGTGVGQRRAAMLPTEQADVEQLDELPFHTRSRPRPLSSKFSDTSVSDSAAEKTDDNDKASTSTSTSEIGKDEKVGDAAIDALEAGADAVPRRPMRFEAAIFMGISTGFSFRAYDALESPTITY